MDIFQPFRKSCGIMVRPRRYFTDDDRRAVTVEIPIHPDFVNKKVDIQKLKVNHIKRLRAIGVNKSTLEKCVRLESWRRLKGRVKIKFIVVKRSPRMSSSGCGSLKHPQHNHYK